MLLYLVKHMRPDLANTGRKPSKVMDGAMQVCMKVDAASDQVHTGNEAVGSENSTRGHIGIELKSILRRQLY